MIRVLGRISSINVRKVLWTLDELGLPFEREDWGLPLRDPNVPEFLALNPNAQVPVLIDGDVTLWESGAIMRYLLARVGAHAIVPQGAKALGLVEQWLTWQATDLNTAGAYAIQALIRKNPANTDPALIADSLQRWGQLMAIFDRQLEATGAWAAGENFSLADIALGLSTHRWQRAPFDHPPLPHVAAYYKRLLARPAAIAHLDPAVP